jgi:murein DD-endopeptidase MepM/ murein hydrolase activator NlpD
MKIYQALSPTKLNQGFDMNPNMAEFYKKLGMTNHGGYDFSAYTGQKVYFDCDCDGYVLNTEIDNNGGLGINIITEDKDGIFKHRYWHLKGFGVVSGQKVSSGSFLGYADNTGASTGSHLHRDLKEMARDSNGNLSIKDYNNGTFGTIRWDRFYQPIFVLNVLKINIIKKLLELYNQLLEALKTK